MNTRSTLLSTPVLFLLAMTLLAEVGAMISMTEGVDDYGRDFLFSIGFIWATGSWLSLDSRTHKVTPPYCTGIFLNIAWPIILIHHLYQTRSGKGLLIFFGFITLLVVLRLLSFAAAYLALNGMPVS